MNPFTSRKSGRSKRGLITRSSEASYLLMMFSLKKRRGSMPSGCCRRAYLACVVVHSIHGVVTGHLLIIGRSQGTPETDGLIGARRRGEDSGLIRHVPMDWPPGTPGTTGNDTLDSGDGLADAGDSWWRRRRSRFFGVENQRQQELAVINGFYATRHASRLNSQRRIVQSQS